MPIYRFHLNTQLLPEAVIKRIQAITDEPRGFLASIHNAWDETSPAPLFLGRVEGHSFHLRRDIRYRNSFLPRIHGQIRPTFSGSTISVIMLLDPFVAVFMLAWLAGVGGSVWQNPDALTVGMLIFGILLPCGGFFPEALKARSLLEAAINNPARIDG